MHLKRPSSFGPFDLLVYVSPFSFTALSTLQPFVALSTFFIIKQFGPILSISIHFDQDRPLWTFFCKTARCEICLKMLPNDYQVVIISNFWDAMVVRDKPYFRSAESVSFLPSHTGYSGTNLLEKTITL